MDFPEIWPQLSPTSRAWLVEHNGEPLPDDMVDEILRVAGGEPDPRWWSGTSTAEGESQLTDEAVDWIETAANDEES